MTTKPWCGQCGGTCFKMAEHFGEGDHFPAIEDGEDDGDGYDPGDECGRWSNGRLTGSCTKAGSEECDWECPHRMTLYRARQRSTSRTPRRRSGKAKAAPAAPPLIKIMEK